MIFFRESDARGFHYSHTDQYICIHMHRKRWYIYMGSTKSACPRLSIDFAIQSRSFSLAFLLFIIYTKKMPIESPSFFLCSPFSANFSLALDEHPVKISPPPLSHPSYHKFHMKIKMHRRKFAIFTNFSFSRVVGTPLGKFYPPLNGASARSIRQPSLRVPASPPDPAASSRCFRTSRWQFWPQIFSEKIV